MRIRTQIIISIIVSVLVIAVVGTILFFNYQQLAVASENEQIADDIVQGSYELSNLQNDYLLHNSDRSRSQWEEKYHTLQDQFSHFRITDPVQQVTLKSILESDRQLLDIFSRIVESGKTTGSANGAPADPELIQIRWSRLGVQTQGMIFDASRLSGMIKADTSRIQQENNWLIVFMISALLLVILLNYVIVNRHILRSLEALRKGTGIIGSGNLDYSLDESSKDELGDLSRAFNRMTGNLKLVTASKADLEREVAERKRAEENLARSNRELQQFAYVSSHDLQEPLRMISSFVQLLEKRYKGKLDQDADEFIGFVVEGTSRMQRMIQDLLTFSRVQSRGVEFAPVDTNEVFEKTVFSHQIMIKEAGAVVTKDDLPTVMGDETQLSQLFQNLIDNAIKFRRAEETPKVHISAQRKGNDWEFSVQDNGIGIDPQYFDRIFIIFQRLHSREAYEGTGIGLAVCMRIVERHGGRIWVESEPGRGSLFHFTLPAVR
jgi:signal transduction histidine kinase